MEALSFFPLIWMILSDLRVRTIGLFPLIAFGILVMIGVGILEGWSMCVQRIIGNGILLLFLVGGAGFYLRLRYGRLVKVMFNYIGMGDLVFLLCLTPSFGIVEFTWFLITSFVLSVITYFLFPVWRDRGIPLVTTVGVCYMGYILFLKIYHL